MLLLLDTTRSSVSLPSRPDGTAARTTITAGTREVVLSVLSPWEIAIKTATGTLPAMSTFTTLSRHSISACSTYAPSSPGPSRSFRSTTATPFDRMLVDRHGMKV